MRRETKGTGKVTKTPRLQYKGKHERDEKKKHKRKNEDNLGEGRKHIVWRRKRERCDREGTGKVSRGSRDWCEKEEGETCLEKVRREGNMVD